MNDTPGTANCHPKEHPGEALPGTFDPNCGPEAVVPGKNPNPAGPPIRIATLVSGQGRGTNFQALMEACQDGRIPGIMAALISTTPHTPAMERAHRGGVQAIYLGPAPATDGQSQADANDLALDRLLQDLDINLVCLAGFMRKVGPRVLTRFPNRIMNIHPALMPAFCGPRMFGIHVHEAVLAYGARVTGCTVQFIEEEYDSGPIILQTPVLVADDDTPESLSARVLLEEHRTYIEAVRLFAEGRLRVDGRRVRSERMSERI